jgi:hypothetical protein
MAKQIKATDIFENDDIFKGIRDSAIQTISTLDKMNAEFIQLATTMKKSIGQQKFDSTKSINEFLTVQTKANTLMEKSINIQKAKSNAEKAAAQSQQQLTKNEIEREKLEQQRIRTAQAKAKADQQAAREAERLAKAEERAAAAAEKEASAYAKLEAETRDLKNQSKELYAQMLKLEQEGKRNTDQYRQLARTYGDVTDRAREQHQQLIQIDAAVGDNFRNVGNYTTQWQNLQAVLGTVGLAFGIQQLFTGVKSAVDEMKKLRKEASMLGMEGSNIDKFATNVKALSDTFGVDQQELTLAANSMMKQFGMSADETFRVLKEGYMSGANAQGDLTQQVKEYATQMKDAGGNADTLMMILSKSNKAGIFSDKGIDVVKEFGLRIREQTKTTRTAMNDAFGKDFTERIFKGINDGSITTVQALEEVSRKMNDTTIPTNKLQTVVADVFAGPGEDAGLEYLKTLTDIGSATGNLVEKNDPFVKQMEKMERLNQELAAAQLEFAKSLGSGASSIDELIIKAKILFFTVFIPAAGFILKVVAAFGLLRAAIWINNGGLKELAQSFTNMGNVFQRTTTQANANATAQRGAGQAAQTAGQQTQAAGRAMNAVPWVLLITLAIQFATALYDIASGAAAARTQHELMEKEKQASNKNATKITERMNKDRDKELAQLERLRKGYHENGKFMKISVEEYNRRRAAILKGGKEELNTLIGNASQRKKVYQDAKKEFVDLQKRKKNASVLDSDEWTKIQAREKQLMEKYKSKLKLTGEAPEAIEAWGRAMVGSFGNKVNVYTSIRELDRRIAGVDERIGIYKENLENTVGMERDFSVELNENSNQVADNTSKIKAHVPAMKAENIELEKMNEYLSEQNTLLNELNQTRLEGQIFLIDERIKKELEAQKKLVEESILIGDNQDIKYNTANLEKLLQEKARLERQQIEERVKFERDEASKWRTEQIVENRKTLEDEYKKALDEAKGNKAAIAKIEQDYRANQQIAAENELQIESDYKLKIQNINEKANNEIMQLNKKTDEETINSLKEVTDAVTTETEKQTQTKKDADDKEMENLKAIMDKRNEWAKWLTDYFIQQSDKRIEQIDKEIEAAENQFDVLQELAKNGNINAKESLAEQQRLINEANKMKAKEERRKQAIELASSVYQTYNNKVAEGVENPLMDTIKDTVLLQQFVNTLIGSMPSFMDGTEDTGVNGQGVDGKGGFHAILHPNERVVPKGLNQMIGDLTNEELATIAQEYQNGKIVRGNSQIMSALNTAVLVSKLDELKSTIQNKPEHNIELGQITSSMVEILDTKKTGNVIQTNRFKVRK